MIDIITIFNHELFDEDIQFDYDFAILHLAEISKFPSKAGFIALPSATDEPADGEAMIVTGWGDTQNPLESPLFLRAVEVPIYNRILCNKPYSFTTITDRMICAGFPEGG